MRPRLRKAVFTAHLTVSVGWIGAVAAYLALDITVASSDDPQTLRAAYEAMEVIASSAIVPLAFAAVITGLMISLGTQWGLFRHYWVVVSFLLTVFALVVLLSETGTITAHAVTATDPSTSLEELRALGSTLVHSVGGITVLLVVLVLNVYKPKGLTRYGWRKQREPHPEPANRA